MTNTFVFEGIVANIWRYAVALLFCLVCYRHPNLPPKPLKEIRTEADFVTSRLLKSHLGVLVEVEENYRFRVHGFLHSWDYPVILVDFLKENRGWELTVPDNHDPSELRAPRGIIEAAISHNMSKVN